MNRYSNLAEKLDRLSPDQIAAVENFIEFLRMSDQDRTFARASAAASEAAFNAVWSNPEDDVYDAL